MTWIDSRKEADRFDKLLSNNKVLPSEWRHSLPMFIVQAPIPVVRNAYLLARGIIEAVEKYHPELITEKEPSEYTV